MVTTAPPVATDLLRVTPLTVSWTCHVALAVTTAWRPAGHANEPPVEPAADAPAAGTATSPATSAVASSAERSLFFMEDPHLRGRACARHWKHRERIPASRSIARTRVPGEGCDVGTLDLSWAPPTHVTPAAAAQPRAVPCLMRLYEVVVVHGPFPLQEREMSTTTAIESTAWRPAEVAPLDDETLRRVDSWWRAANYLSVGQIYLLANPLLRTPLTRDDVKPRLLGHWGTTPGLNFLYAHLNRAIAERAQSTIYITGPGHGGPGLVANAYLDGTYSEIYSDITPDAEGISRLFKQFSFPGGIPSHVAPETPGSIHEVANSATPCPMRTGRHSTTPICSSRRSSATAKPRPVPWPPAGTPTSSSIRSRTAWCYRSCISTGTRSPIRLCWIAFRPTNCEA